MAWNQPGNKGPDRDPWGNGRNGNKKGAMKVPSDIDDIFRKFSSKLGFSGNSNQGNHSRLFAMVIAVLAVIWVLSGFYTIKEAERGVVLRFGKFSHLVGPGLNWKPTFIDEVTPVNVETVHEIDASGPMLTADENVVQVKMNVQYRITEPKDYLFNVNDANDSLQQATDSALRGVIGKYKMDTILTEGRTIIRNDTQKELEDTIRPYHIGITLLDVNFQTARPPEEVKAAFDDAIAARENEQQYIREAEAYSNEVKPKANGQAQRILEDARAYKVKTVLEAQGEIAGFTKLLPEYKAAPEVTRERLYLDAMQGIYSHTRKILLGENKGSNVVMLPLAQLLAAGQTATLPTSTVMASTANNNAPKIFKTPSTAVSSNASSSNTAMPQSGRSADENIDDILEQRRANTQRTDDSR